MPYATQPVDTRILLLELTRTPPDQDALSSLRHTLASCGSVSAAAEKLGCSLRTLQRALAWLPKAERESLRAVLTEHGTERSRAGLLGISDRDTRVIAKDRTIQRSTKKHDKPVIAKTPVKRRSNQAP